MRLEGNFYNIDSIAAVEDGYTATLTLAAQHPIYQGHFPSQAVVPGVCTLTIIREIIGRILQRDVHFVTIKECKYLSALIPTEGLQVVLNITITENKVRATAVRVADNQTALKLRAEIE
ncbi:MAG: hydroxymyristoyl-ACP dehydratase [Alistipes sp.]|nr:hydroxymyristoyl-ACP dehydratase [Alistipes sp.]